MTKLTGQQIADETLTGWVYLLHGLETRIRTSDFATGLALVNAIGAEAEAMNHHPDLDLHYSSVGVRLTSHDAGGVTDRDVRLARAISAMATDAGLTTGDGSNSRLEFALDTPSMGTILPFWGAVLSLEYPESTDDLVDPDGVLPSLWFQPSGDEEPRQHWHPDVWVDPAQVQPRIDAALAAGGTLVSDEQAPSFWVLADPEGNKVCLCTWQARDPS